MYFIIQKIVMQMKNVMYEFCFLSFDFLTFEYLTSITWQEDVLALTRFLNKINFFIVYIFFVLTNQNNKRQKHDYYGSFKQAIYTVLSSIRISLQAIPLKLVLFCFEKIEMKPEFMLFSASHLNPLTCPLWILLDLKKISL